MDFVLICTSTGFSRTGMHRGFGTGETKHGGTHTCGLMGDARRTARDVSSLQRASFAQNALIEALFNRFPILSTTRV